jgi:hypothetical protein
MIQYVEADTGVQVEAGYVRDVAVTINIAHCL